MTISAQAPCRVDLAGGTLDIWPLYLFHFPAFTVNFAVDLYARCWIETRPDSRIELRSLDQRAEESFASLEALQSAPRYRLPLLAEAVRFFAPPTGITLRTDSEAPAGAGISGSSALLIAMAAALDRLTGRGYSLERLREVSQNIEARVIRVPTGCQDYYPALYGGLNAIELRVDGIKRHAIPVDCAGFDERFALAYTGEPRQSGINNWEVMKAHIDGDARVHANFDRIAEIAAAMRGAVERADWPEAGRLLRAEWASRRANVPTITTPLIDRLVEATRTAGALGAKVCGAGGGGCVVFLVESGARQSVEQIIAREGATVLPARLASDGVRVAEA